MTDNQVRFATNCLIAYENIMENLEDGKQGDANQLLSAIALVIVNGVEYQVQLVLNSEKESWISATQVGFCSSKTTGFGLLNKEFDA